MQYCDHSFSLVVCFNALHEANILFCSHNGIPEFTHLHVFVHCACCINTIVSQASPYAHSLTTHAPQHARNFLLVHHAIPTLYTCTHVCTVVGGLHCSGSILVIGVSLVYSFPTIATTEAIPLEEFQLSEPVTEIIQPSQSETPV